MRAHGNVFAKKNEGSAWGGELGVRDQVLVVIVDNISFALRLGAAALARRFRVEGH